MACKSSCCGHSKIPAQPSTKELLLAQPAIQEGGGSCSGEATCATGQARDDSHSQNTTITTTTTTATTNNMFEPQHHGCCSVERPTLTISPVAGYSEQSKVTPSCCVGEHKHVDKADSCCTTPVSIGQQSGCSTLKTTTGQDLCCITKECSSGSDAEDSGSRSSSQLEFQLPLTDLEKGVSVSEHIILGISDMTCTGCEADLQHSLGLLKQVRNLKTSLVLARAEFDLGPGDMPVAGVLKHLKRTTRFKGERMMNRGSGLDLIAPKDPSSFVHGEWPHGVTDMTVTDKKAVYVAYDPHVIGARDLVEKGWDTPIELAPPRADPTIASGRKHGRHLLYMTLLSIALTIPVLVMAWSDHDPSKEVAYSSASLALATIVQVVVAGPFYPAALKSLIFSRIIEMDLLIVLSTSAAYVFSVVSYGYLVAGQPLPTGHFFETSTLLVTLIMVGRWVTAFARQMAIESVSIRSLQTSMALLVEDGGRNMREIDARLLQFGDVFRVVPESRIPTDGTIVSGSSEVDESMITGEAHPVEKHMRSTVVAGTVNGSGTLDVRLTRLPGDNTITSIAGMVDEAKLTKPKIQAIADRVASCFVPVVVVLMVITLVTWIIVGLKIRGQSGSEATIQAITYAITVLIVSCPCAIGLAVPMVIVIASSVAAERGVIFKSSESIEVAHKTSHVVFDKTGTLTEGKLAVVVEEYVKGSASEEVSASLLLGLVGDIKHPVSAAVAAHLKSRNVSAPKAVEDIKTLTGKGVQGTTPDAVLQAGNSRWLNLSADPRVTSILSQGYTAFCFTINGSLAAVFGLTDSLRPEALPIVTKLRSHGISVHLISGDDDGAVQAVAKQLKVPGTNVRSRCSPADKQKYIKDIFAAGRQDSQGDREASKPPVVIFCGDGTNDAVALAQATIGIAIQMAEGTGGADVAKSAANVVLVRPNLAGILTVIAVSKKSVNRIRFNFIWSFIYNIAAILWGAGAFVGGRLEPKWAGLGELVSVLPVIFVAVSLRWSKV